MEKTYFQPKTQVTSVALQSVILIGSPGGNTMSVNTGIDTDNQW